jgi:hypothetical protein
MTRAFARRNAFAWVAPAGWLPQPGETVWLSPWHALGQHAEMGVVRYGSRFGGVNLLLRINGQTVNRIVDLRSLRPMKETRDA